VSFLATSNICETISLQIGCKTMLFLARAKSAYTRSETMSFFV